MSRPALPLDEGGGAGTAAVDEEALPPVSYPRMVAVLGLSFAYVLLLQRLGYFISTLLYVVVLLPLLRVRNLLAIAGCALGVPLVLDLLFSRLLGIPLPGGLLDLVDFLP